MALTPLPSSIGQGSKSNPRPSDREPNTLPLDHCGLTTAFASPLLLYFQNLRLRKSILLELIVPVLQLLLLLQTKWRHERWQFREAQGSEPPLWLEPRWNKDRSELSSDRRACSVAPLVECRFRDKARRSLF